MPPPDDPVQERIDYYKNVSFEHFDKNKNSDSISKYSELAPMLGAMTVSTNSPEDEDGNPVDQFETLNNKSENRDHQVNCEIHEGGHRCGRLISFNSLKSHMAEFHDIPKEDKVLCPWASCQHLSYRKNLERHIKTKHLGFKRLLVPQS